MATLSTSRSHTRWTVMTGSEHTNHEAAADISDEVGVKVASCMRGATVLHCPATDDDSRSAD